jgi:ribonuclease D
MNYLNNITNEDIHKLETCYFNGVIHVISRKSSIPAAVDYIRRYSVAGFDTESKPSFRKGQVNKTAMIQLAVPGEVFIFRINDTGFTKELIGIFEDVNILKVGVSIRDDLHRLQQIRRFTPGGFFELQNYSDSFNIESNSLKKLAAIVLGIKVSKSKQLTNWESPNLTEEQLIYAATDAWVCLEIYNKLRKSDE